MGVEVVSSKNPAACTQSVVKAAFMQVLDSQVMKNGVLWSASFVYATCQGLLASKAELRAITSPKQALQSRLKRELEAAQLLSEFSEPVMWGKPEADLLSMISAVFAALRDIDISVYVLTDTERATISASCSVDEVGSLSEYNLMVLKVFCLAATELPKRQQGSLLTNYINTVKKFADKRKGQLVAARAFWRVFARVFLVGFIKAVSNGIESRFERKLKVLSSSAEALSGKGTLKEAKGAVAEMKANTSIFGKAMFKDIKADFESSHRPALLASASMS